MFELMLRHTICITNGPRPIGKQESRFEQERCVWEKNEIYVLKQVVPNENVYTQLIYINMYLYIFRRSPNFFFLPPVN